MDIGVRENSRQAFVLAMYLHRCSCTDESCTFVILFSIILPGRFWASMRKLINGSMQKFPFWRERGNDDKVLSSLAVSP